jgi:hypothetical protein
MALISAIVSKRMWWSLLYLDYCIMRCLYNPLLTEWSEILIFYDAGIQLLPIPIKA